MPTRALVPALLILIVASFSTLRHRAAIEHVAVERDSVIRQFERYASLRENAVHAGDSIPVGKVMDFSGRQVTLADLAASGTRFFYFYRSDCVACQALAPLLDDMPAKVREQTAFIHLGYTRQLAPRNEFGHYAWVADSAAKRIMVSVPSFFAVNDFHRVTGAADFHALRVVNLLDMHGLIRRAAVDSLGDQVRQRTVVDSASQPRVP